MKRTKTRFEYHERSSKDVDSRANQSGGIYDSLYNSDYPMWKCEPGVHTVRFLPPGWDDAKHFAVDMYVHYGVGSDNQSYLCLKQMKGEACPSCEARDDEMRRLGPDGAETAKATKRVLAWIIDRDHEDVGPQLWAMPYSVDKDIAKLCTIKRTKETLFLDRPDAGYDVEFTREGNKKENTRYTATRISRHATPISDDEELQEKWLAYIKENPLPGVFQFYDYDYISKVGAGKRKVDADEDEEDERPTKRGRERLSTGGGKKASREEEDEDDEEDEDEEALRKPSKSKRRPEPEEEEEDEEDDDRPSRARGASKAPAKSTKSRSKDEDEEEEDEEDEDDDFDCVACKDTGKNSKGGFCVCAKGKKLKARSADEEEEDEDDDDEDEPVASAKGNRGVKKAVAKGKAAKQAVEEEDDDEEDEEEEDDDE